MVGFRTKAFAAINDPGGKRAVKVNWFSWRGRPARLEAEGGVMDGCCPTCDAYLPEGIEHSPDQCIAQLRDQREGLHAAVENLMRALKIALRKHNEVLAREAVALDALKQAEEECATARTAWKKERRARSALAAELASLIGEREASPGKHDSSREEAGTP
jgi:hypothetical protein